MFEVFDESTKQALLSAEAVYKTLNSEGWKIMRTILEERISALDSLNGIKSLKELLSRQEAVKVLRQWGRDLDAISTGFEAKIKENKPENHDEDISFLRVKE